MKDIVIWIILAVVIVGPLIYRQYNIVSDCLAQGGTIVKTVEFIARYICIKNGFE